MASLMDGLPPLSQRDKKKIHSIMTKEASLFLARHKTTYCDICGHEFHQSVAPEVCPSCGRKISGDHGRKSCSWRYWGSSSAKINNSYVTDDTTRAYFTVLTTCKGWQVIRTYFSILRKRRKKAATLEIHEVHQWWINKKGEYVLTSLWPSMNYYNDYWSFYSPLDIRSSTNLYNRTSYYSAHNHILTFGELLSVRLIPELKRTSINKEDLQNSNCYLAVIHHALGNHDFEAILKSKQKCLASYLIHNVEVKEKIPPYHAVKLCDRHNYVITNPSDWLDHIKMLKQLGKDTHSPHYVCPVDFNAMHRQIVAEINRERERLRTKEEQEKAKRLNENYIKSHERFLNICLQSEKLKLHVLQDVSEFYEEGKAMRHCVYAGGYYQKKDALILSCRNKETNERVETVELNLSNYTIVQSRGVNNSTTPYHDEIIALVMANIKIFKLANEGCLEQELKFENVA